MKRIGLGVTLLLVVLPGSARGEDRQGPTPTCDGKPAVEVDASPAVTGTSGDDVVVLVGDSAIYDALAGDDTICLGPTIRYALVNGDAGADHISGASAAEARRGFTTEMSGGPGDDEILGSAFRDHIEGGSGDDVVDSGTGGDLLDGDGDDRVGRFTDPFVDGADHVRAGPGNDRVYASIRGDAGESQPDESIGGSGRDALDYGSSRSGIELDVQSGSAEGAASDADDTFSGFDTYEGSGEDDLILGTPGDDHLDGGFGLDRVAGLGGDDRLALARGTVLGGPGADVFHEVASGPRVRALMGWGRDLVTLLSGRHSVDAGPGNDVVRFRGLRGNHTVDGGDGSDLLTTIDCEHERVGNVVTCDRATVTFTRVERFSHRPG